MIRHSNTFFPLSQTSVLAVARLKSVIFPPHVSPKRKCMRRTSLPHCRCAQASMSVYPQHRPCPTFGDPATEYKNTAFSSSLTLLFFSLATHQIHTRVSTLNCPKQQPLPIKYYYYPCVSSCHFPNPVTYLPTT